MRTLITVCYVLYNLNKEIKEKRSKEIPLTNQCCTSSLFISCFLKNTQYLQLFLFLNIYYIVHLINVSYIYAQIKWTVKYI